MEEKKVKKNTDKMEIFRSILNVFLWIVIIVWVIATLVDSLHVRAGKEPKFCWWNEKTYEYDNGSVTECTGLGYKVIKYDREDFQAIEFGPFWITDRTKEK